ncbi:MAG: hypothetical protein LBP58_03245 [Azoarcus sp.]|jgi:hypothetical protein|nr:hypothetical protein [Azoarcus sp.]
MTNLRNIALAILAVLLLAAGFVFGVLAEQRKRAAVETAWAAERARLLEDRLAAQQRARDFERAGEELAARLYETETHRATSALEADHEISRTAAGRECLSADITRLLNQRAAARVPAPAADATQPAAAAARHPDDAASDRDVALWVRHAIDQYNNCRGRLDAIRQWDNEVSGK